MKNSPDSYRRTKITLVGLLFTISGVILIALAHWLSTTPLSAWAWLRAIPFSELGASLFGIGVVGTAYDYYLRVDDEENAVQRLRDTLKAEAPTLRDAVIEGFAIQPADLRRVATPELLDHLATNAVALRLGDDEFARELYADVRDQAIRAAERWYDVRVTIRLSAAAERSASGAPLFDIVIEWEYSTTPSHAVRRFACVSDIDEYNEFTMDVPTTATWFMPPRTGVEASARSSFELLEFTADGEKLPIRRSTRRTGQTYSVTVPHDGSESDTSRRLRQVYRTVGAQSAHKLFLELPAPSRNVSLELDYTDTDIAHITVSDTVSTAARPRVTRMPSTAPGRQIGIDVPGWLLPRSGFTFVWTLSGEQTDATARRKSRPSDAA